jgi:selenoprotein W-related protein
LAEDLLHDHWKTISAVTLVPSSGGVYEITAGDKLIWSKKESGDFPDPEAINKWFGASD